MNKTFLLNPTIEITYSTFRLPLSGILGRLAWQDAVPYAASRYPPTLDSRLHHEHNTRKMWVPKLDQRQDERTEEQQSQKVKTKERNDKNAEKSKGHSSVRQRSNISYDS